MYASTFFFDFKKRSNIWDEQIRKVEIIYFVVTKPKKNQI